MKTGKLPVTAVLICLGLGLFPGCSPGVKTREIPENVYIEVVAKWNILHEMNRRILKESHSDADLVRWVQDQIMRETQAVLDELDVTREDLARFERANPQFLEHPANQQRVKDRIQALIEDDFGTLNGG